MNKLYELIKINKIKKTHIIYKLYKLQKSLLDLVENYEGDQEELRYFTRNINRVGLNLSDLYITALYKNQHDFAQIIIATGRYNIEHDIEIYKDFNNWAIAFKEDSMIRCLDDGFCPDVSTIDNILIEIEGKGLNIVHRRLSLILREHKLGRFTKNK